ncbi:MAG: peptidyl-prolyl cis-trans isomerase [Candidatus Sumerlaeaceae bacterium]|nr:peptidyl-prolyl cis-trans isomerase [Candidatus Sumerlaeaceae bacterium]
MNKRTMLRLSLCLAASVLFATPPQSVRADETTGPLPTPTEVARIGGKVVTQEELLAYTDLVEQVEPFERPNPATALEDLVLQKGIHDVMTTVPKREKPARMIPTSYPYASQRNYLAAQLRGKIDEETTVPRSEMEEWLKEKIDLYTQKEQVTARHLFMQTSADNEASAPAKVRARMEEVLAKIKGGLSFADAATSFSEAASAQFGGSIGRVSRRQPIGPESKPMNIVLEEALFKLRAGEVSDIIETKHGFHLMYAEDRQTTYIPTVDDLLTSGILPGVLKTERVTSAVRERIEKSIADHKGRIVETTASDSLTSETPAIEFGGRILTVADFEQMFGQRFTAAFERSRSNPDTYKSLMQQALENEAIVQAAVDEKLDQLPKVKQNLKLLEERELMKQRLTDIIANAYPVTEAQLKARYEEIKDEIRQPEGAGHIITITADEESTDPALIAKANEEARKKAQELLDTLKATTGTEAEIVAAVEKAAREMSKDNRAFSGGLVERHRFGSLTDQAGRDFDSIAPGLQPGQFSNLRQMEKGFAFARLAARYPGEPMPFEAVKARIQNRLRAENTQKARADLLAMLERKGFVEWLPGAEVFGKKPKSAVKVTDASADKPEQDVTEDKTPTTTQAVSITPSTTETTKPEPRRRGRR